MKTKRTDTTLGQQGKLCMFARYNTRPPANLPDDIQSVDNYRVGQKYCGGVRAKVIYTCELNILGRTITPSGLYYQQSAEMFSLRLSNKALLSINKIKN